MDKRHRKTLSYLILLSILTVNLALAIYDVYNNVDITPATLSVMNVITIGLFFCSLAIQARQLKTYALNRPPGTPYLHAVAGTMIGCVSIVSIVFTLNSNFAAGYLAAFFSCVLSVIVYAYIIFLRDHL